MQHSHTTYLVIGSSGKNGSRVVRKLRDLHHHALSTVRRDTHPTSDSRIFEWQDRSTWASALQGVDTLYIIHPDTSMLSAYEEIKALVDVSKEQNISKLVLLSGRGQPSVERCEQLVKSSGLKWTIIRSAWFNQNFSEGHFVPAIQQGELTFMAGSAKEPFVDLEDLTDVIVQSLIDDQHNGQIYEVTGADMYTFEEALHLIGEYLDKPLQYKHVDADTYRELLQHHGLPQDIAQHMAFAFAEILDGRNATVGDGVQQVLGRKPIAFRDFITTTFTTA